MLLMNSLKKKRHVAGSLNCTVTPVPYKQTGLVWSQKAINKKSCAQLWICLTQLVWMQTSQLARFCHVTHKFEPYHKFTRPRPNITSSVSLNMWFLDSDYSNHKISGLCVQQCKAWHIKFCTGLRHACNKHSKDTLLLYCHLNLCQLNRLLSMLYLNL